MASSRGANPVIGRREAFDVAVVGGGNAGLCAALCAADAGARVVVVESAPRAFRGGNSRHTRNLRCMHETPTDVLAGVYSEDEYFDDLMRVTAGHTNETLARLVVRQSATCTNWMRQYGVRLQASLRGTLHLNRTNAFFLGGGRALLNTLYTAAEQRGVEVRYDTEVVDLDIDGRHFHAVEVECSGRRDAIHAKAAVLAAGGFESNFEWLREAWGPAADNFLVRGTRYNKGRVLQLMIKRGAEPVGDPKQCHAVAIDARAPKFDGGIVTRLDCVPFGIVVNNRGERFYDEGEDFWPSRYAIWGRLVAQQPDQIAFAIVDSKSAGHFMPSVFPPIEADTIAGLAVQLHLSPAALEETVAAFNRGTLPGRFDPSQLDDCRTEGLHPNKTHWAVPLDTPPFWGYPLRPGITFTYLGVRVDTQARVVMADGRPAANLFAAGEIMAGNILGRGYVAGVGMSIGTVFGRIAGEEGARAIQ